MLRKGGAIFWVSDWGGNSVSQKAWINQLWAMEDQANYPHMCCCFKETWIYGCWTTSIHLTRKQGVDQKWGLNTSNHLWHMVKRRTSNGQGELALIDYTVAITQKNRQLAFEEGGQQWQLPYFFYDRLPLKAGKLMSAFKCYTFF